MIQRHVPITAKELRRAAKQRLDRLSAERLQVALDFLAYLEERESAEATDELVRIPGLLKSLQETEQQGVGAKLSEWRKVRRDV